MDSQRRQAYLELIQALLKSPSGQEIELLQAHREPVDQGLVQVTHNNLGNAYHRRIRGE